MGFSTVQLQRYTGYVLAALAVWITARCAVSLLLRKTGSELWGWVQLPGGEKIPLRHCMNSGAVLGFRELGAETQLCRPGLLIYGVYPEREHFGLELRPVMTLKTRILALTNHKAGDSISYGRTWQAERDSRLAVIPVGYKLREKPPVDRFDPEKIHYEQYGRQER